jgi:hypothetical protein
MVRSSVLSGLLGNIYPNRHDHVGCGRRVADACLAPAPRASAACLFEPAARAVLQSMIVAPEARKPPASGRLCRKFSQSSSNLAQARVVDAVYVRLDPVSPGRSQLLVA